jgi:hypothetical protein
MRTVLYYPTLFAQITFGRINVRLNCAKTLALTFSEWAGFCRSLGAGVKNLDLVGKNDLRILARLIPSFDPSRVPLRLG